MGPLKFLLDTRTSYVPIPNWLAAKLIKAGQVHEDDLLGDSTSTLADGCRIRNAVIRLRNIQIGNIVVHSVQCEVSGDGMPLLGQNVLHKFTSWSIDNRSQTLNVTWD